MVLLEVLKLYSYLFTNLHMVPVNKYSLSGLLAGCYVENPFHLGIDISTESGNHTTSQWMLLEIKFTKHLLVLKSPWTNDVTENHACSGIEVTT